MNQHLKVAIETKCKHCDQTIRIQVDSDMHISVSEGDADPLLFMPDIDWINFTEPTIIDSY